MARVLVADDDEEIRAVVRAILEDVDHTVLEAENATQALHILQHASDGLVLLFDYGMPGVADAGLLEALATDGGALAKRHACILLTGMSAQHLPRQTRHLLAELGIPTIEKPFDISDLAAAVDAAAARLPSAGA